MPRHRASWGPRDAPDHAWPTWLSLRAPYAGDELVYDPADPKDIERHGTRLDAVPDDFEERDRAFHDTYVAVLEGREPWSAAAPVAHALELDAPTRHDKRWTDPAPVRLTDSELAFLAEDWVPEVGVVAPDRVLGPFADEDLPRPVRRAAASVMAFSPLLPQRMMPVVRQMRCPPKPPVPIRDALRSALLAPPMLWALDRAQLTPALPLGRRFPPELPLHPAPDAPAVLGRAIPFGETTWLAGALPLPGLPPRDIVVRRLELEQNRLRRHDRRTSWEDLLRDRAEVLYRVCCEWWYEQDADATLALWAAPSTWPEP